MFLKPGFYRMDGSVTVPSGVELKGAFDQGRVPYRIGAVINVYGGQQMYTYRYEDSSYFGFETEPPGKRVSLFPLYERFYRNISLELFQQTVPVISMLFAPGFLAWIFAWTFVGFIREKDRKAVIVYLPVLILWLTVLLGPTVLVRYVLILWFVVPMMLVHILKGNTSSVTK